MANRTSEAKARVARLDVPDDDPEATQVLAAVDTTQPLEVRTADRTPAIRDLDDMAAATFDKHIRTLASLAQVRREETARHARKTADLDAMFTLAGMLADAGAHLAEVDHVPDELRVRVAERAAAWANGGGSS